MCWGALARALGLKMAAKFSPPPSTSVSTGTSSSSVNTDHIAMSTTRRPLIPTSQQQQEDGLPKAFVASLRVLFDILDEDKDGFVPLAEIKERWQSDEGPSGLPDNVIDCLAKVAPKNGKLSFERFCSGLRLALANGKGHSPDRGSPNRSDRQPKATVRPNVVHPMRSIKSAPQLRRDEKRPRSMSENDGGKSTGKLNNIMYNKLPASKPGKKQQRYSTGNYETYYARPVNNTSDVASSDSYEDHNIYKRYSKRRFAEDPKEKIDEGRKANEKIYEDRKEELYKGHKIYEDREKIYESRKETSYEDRKDKIYEVRKEKINDEDRNPQDKVYDDGRAKRNEIRKEKFDRKEIIYEDRNQKIYEDHRARLNGIRLRVQNRQTSKGESKEKQEEDAGPGPSRKDVPPNPYSHADYMDYETCITPDIWQRQSQPNRTMSPAPASRALSPSARPTSPTRPVSPSPTTTSSTSSRPRSLASRSLSPASRKMSPTSRVNEKEQRRRSGSRERKSGRQLLYESPVENGHREKVLPQPESAKGRSSEKGQVFNTNHNSNHVSPHHPGGGGLRVSDPSVSIATSNKRVQRRQRDESRRHTSNGISVDYNLLKRMKQLEQERDVLIQGLEAVDRAKSWYQRQLADVKQKQRYVHNGQFAHGEDPNSQSQQDRLAFQSLRIVEVNRQLAALVESSENGFPDHINLAMQGRRSIYLPVDTPISAQLRDQNRMLTKEVTSQSGRIAQLEQEKTTLIRQLFDVRGKSHREREVREPTETSLFL
ncbi:uncharacterized protein [Amphiura filiformis]|uniref:uncharacterized protein n=1 Tax=Amphiura filiformis TaxID=82378 RepID=UPI003B21C095